MPPCAELVLLIRRVQRRLLCRAHLIGMRLRALACQARRRMLQAQRSQGPC